MPVTNLRKVQLGQESSWGTGVAATAILMGVTDASLSVADEVHQTAEQGTMYPSPLVAEIKQSGEGSIKYDASYEDILFALDGIFGDCSPTGSDPYTWAYSAPTTTAPTPREYTMEFGAPSAEYQMIGGIFNTLAIEGDVDGDGVWTVSADVIGKAVEAEAMTSLSSRTVELIRMADTALYIDAWGGTIGSTAVATSLISFSLSVDPKYHLKHFAGAVAPGDFGEAQWEGSLSLTAEFNATVKAYVDALLTPALVQRQIRLKATSGTKTATLDFAGTLTDGVTLFEDRDGNMTVALTFNGTYNSTLSNWFKAEAVNSVATLP